MKKFIFVLGILIICALAFWLQKTFPDVKEAISTLLGALIALGGTCVFNQHNTEKAARYLAIRVVCIFDKYLTDCVAVVKDDGLSYGQRTPEGYLDPQVLSPGAPLFPTDVDWKSIDHTLMYEILSFPSDVDAADESIAFTWRVIASPPDFEEYFEERAFHYAQFGLRAHELASRLRKKYNIPAKKYGDWNPITELEQEWDKLKRARAQRENAAADWTASMKKPEAVAL